MEKSKQFVFCVVAFLSLVGCTSMQWRLIDAGRRFSYGTHGPADQLAAREKFQLAAETAKSANDLHALAVAYQEIGFTHKLENRNYSEARKWIEKSKEVAEKNGFKYILAENHHNLADLSFMDGSKTQTCPLVAKSRQLLTELLKQREFSVPTGASEETIENTLQRQKAIAAKSWGCSGI